MREQTMSFHISALRSASGGEVSKYAVSTESVVSTSLKAMVGRSYQTSFADEATTTRAAMTTGAHCFRRKANRDVVASHKRRTRAAMKMNTAIRLRLAYTNAS